MIAVYIIETHFGTYYTGLTNSIIRRWREHSSGQSSYLKRVKPKEVVWIWFVGNYTIARRLEKNIKRVGANKFYIRWNNGSYKL